MLIDDTEVIQKIIVERGQLKKTYAVTVEK